MERVVKMNQDLRILWLQSNPQPFFKELFCELEYYSDKYIKNIFSGPGNIIKNHAIYNDDFHTPYVNTFEGLRVTIGQPEIYSNSIYLLGPSWVYGFGVEDCHTIASFLQKETKYCVNNFGVRGGPVWNSFLHLKNIKLQHNDWVVFMVPGEYDEKTFLQILKMNSICTQCKANLLIMLAPSIHRITHPTENELILESHPCELLYNNKINKSKLKRHNNKYIPSTMKDKLDVYKIISYDMQLIFNRPHEYGEFFFDSGHWIYKANQLVAEVVNKIIVMQQEDVQDIDHEAMSIKNLLQIVRNRYSTPEIENFVGVYKNKNFPRNGKIGCIVMNANPFTNGHLGLVEKSLEIVEYLYIFVVQNDASFFSFEERIMLVKDNVSRLKNKNIHVIPSGNFIISSFTFPEYFAKETKNIKADSTIDVLIFAAIIAEKFNINYRFVGNEPTCRLTRCYNEIMEKYLPVAKINFLQFDRKKHENTAISASIVRTSYKNHDVQKIKEFVPLHTFIFLLKKMLTTASIPLQEFIVIFAEAKALGVVDINKYLESNSDVKLAIESNLLPSAEYHYIFYGRNENRKIF